MKDVQAQKDFRNVYLNQVGIKNFRTPLILMDPKNATQHTVATASLSVDLNHDIRGTHMSRFVEIMNEVHVLHPHETRSLLTDLIQKMEAESAFLTLDFPYFIDKKAPVSGISSRLDIDCTISARLTQNSFRFSLTVGVPVTTLCPCSKEISDYGAHNQRAVAKITVETNDLIWIEDLADMAERNASCAIYPLLKRVDEKKVTEYAYENPRFVEDMTRDIYNELKQMENLSYFKVEVESIESIHNHNAFACAYSGEEKK